MGTFCRSNDADQNHPDVSVQHSTMLATIEMMAGPHLMLSFHHGPKGSISFPADQLHTSRSSCAPRCAIVADNTCRPDPGVKEYGLAVRAKPGISSVLMTVGQGLEVSGFEA
jgi:hypothetical protein